MTRAIFQWLNNDSTADLNKRFGAVFKKGITEGGGIATVSGQLSLDVVPYVAMTENGLMLVEESTYRFENIPLNAATVLTVYGKWVQAGEPEIEYRMYEVSAYNNLLDKDDHIVFGLVTLGGSETEVLTSNLTFDLRDEFDKIGRSSYRGTLDNSVDLPTSNNRTQDWYVVGGAGGGLVEIWAWNDVSWINITNTLALQAQLTDHRNNAYVDEKHLTDDEKLAVLGTTGTPNASNRFVTNSDPRVPNLSTVAALTGTDGTPSTTNKYVTEEYSLSAVDYLNFPLPPGVLAMSGLGEVYVGKGPVGSANTNFGLLEIGNDRGYINLSGIYPAITNVYKDSLLTQPLNPGVDADSQGYYSGNLWITVNDVIDTGVRVAFTRKYSLKTIDRGFTNKKGPAGDFVSGEARMHIQNIKGRDYDTLLPSDESNKVLREDVDQLISYLGSNQNTTITAANEDYEYFAEDPKLAPYFEKNIDIAPIYTYENSALNNFTHNVPNGQIVYSGSPDLTSVIVGNLFQDGIGKKFRVSAITLPNIISIVELDTGLRPLQGAVSTSVASSVDGSIITNNNPRNLLLSELKGNSHEIIKFNALYRLKEFSKPEGRPAFGISQGGKRINPRVVLYGSWIRKADNSTGEIILSNTSSIGDIQYTGFVSDLYLLCKATPGAPNLEVTVNGEPSVTVVSVSQSGQADPVISYTKGERYHRVAIRRNLNPDIPSTINIKIQGASSDPLVVIGLEALTIDSTAINRALDVHFESGVAFNNTKITSKDTRSVSTVFVPSNKIGSNYTLYLDKDINDNTIVNIADTPVPVSDFEPNYMSVIYSSPGVYNYADASEQNKSTVFKVGDLVEALGSTKAELTRIISLTPSLQLSPSPTAENKLIRMVCSLGDNTPSDLGEEWANRYEIITHFVNYTDSDFSTRNAGAKTQRYVTSSDGLTTLGAKNATISIDRRSVIVPVTTGQVDFGVLGTRLDLEFDNLNPVTLEISVDGSSYYAFSIPAGISRRTLYNRSRYTHRTVSIRSTSGEFQITHLTVYSLERPSIRNKMVLTTSDVVSPFNQEYTKQITPYTRSIGKYFMDAMHHGIVTRGAGINTPWSWSDTAHYLGRVLNTQNDGDAIKFTVVGEGFEIAYLQRLDGGRATVTINGVAWNAIPGATITAGFASSAYLDTYGASTGMRLAAITGLSYGVHEVVIAQDNPRTKNVASTGYHVGIFGLFNLSISGRLRMTYDTLNQHYTPVSDVREFASFYTGLIGDEAFPIDLADEVKSAYARLDGTGTPVNCFIDNSTGKTRITLSFNFVLNAFPGTPFGELQVSLDGREIPRYIAGTTQQAYFKEITSNVIELDGDYSATEFDVFIKKINGPTQTPVPYVGPAFNGALGDFVYSPALSLAQFQALRDTTWVAANGASILGSDLANMTGYNTLPNQPGYFVKINN